jgi:hypothetical protein
MHAETANSEKNLTDLLKQHHMQRLYREGQKLLLLLPGMGQISPVFKAIFSNFTKSRSSAACIQWGFLVFPPFQERFGRRPQKYTELIILYRSTGG